MDKHNFNKLEYTKLTPEEMEQRHILGRLVGIISDYKKPTRNGRKYPKELWENLINNDELFKEAIENRTIFAQLEHPDYENINMMEACACLSELKICDDGYVRGVWDILDLPNGKILKTICDYGTVIGCSSRATGDIEEDYDGQQVVSPDTFMLTTWDMVLTPSVKEARLQLVNESLDTKRINLMEQLNKQVNETSDDSEKKIMKETLDRLNFNKDIITSDSVNVYTNDAKLDVATSVVANDNGTKELVASLQEALKESSDLKVQLKKLQEQLAVSDTKVNKLNEELDNYKSSTVRLSEVSSKSKKEFSEKISNLEEQLTKKEKELKTMRDRNSKLIESVKKSNEDAKTINENLSSKSNSIKTLTEKLANVRNEYETKINKLNEELLNEKKTSENSINEVKQKISKISKLCETYKKASNNVMNRYIQSKASFLGVTSKEIINRLNENYTIDDVDEVCNELRDYNVRMNKLPFTVNSNIRVKIKESKEPLMDYVQESPIDDDYVDDSLLKLAEKI